MLELLKGFHGSTIHLPTKRTWRPDPSASRRGTSDYGHLGAGPEVPLLDHEPVPVEAKEREAGELLSAAVLEPRLGAPLDHGAVAELIGPPQRVPR